MRVTEWLDRLSARLSHGVISLGHAARYALLRLRGREMHGVRVILEHGDKVLLVRHLFAPSVWTLPGGVIAPGESAEEAAVREVFEETGLTIRSFSGEVGRYHGSMGARDTVSVLCTSDWSGTLRLFPNHEILERAFFAADGLPAHCSPANRRRIEAYRRGVRNERATW